VVDLVTLRAANADSWAHANGRARASRRADLSPASSFWPHHVDEIWDGPDKRGRWLVHSDNDGNAVRTR
jgi:hypothetical protein